MVFEQQLQATPEDAQRHVLLGLALAYMGQKTEAVREGERAVALVPHRQGYVRGPYIQHQLARIYLLVGEHEKALDRSSRCSRSRTTSRPVGSGSIPTSPRCEGNPRFERLLMANPKGEVAGKP